MRSDPLATACVVDCPGFEVGVVTIISDLVAPDDVVPSGFVTPDTEMSVVRIEPLLSVTTFVVP